MKNTTALEVIEDMEDGKKIFVVFKSQQCHYCVAIEPALKYLSNKYSNLDMRYVDTESDDFGVFEENIDGVPTIALISEGKFSLLKEPKDPDERTWYSLGYLEEAIKTFLGE